MDDSDPSPDLLSHSQMRFACFRSLSSSSSSHVFMNRRVLVVIHTTLLLFHHHHHLCSIILHEESMHDRRDIHLEKRGRGNHPRVALLFLSRRTKSFIRDRRHHHQMNDERRDQPQVNSTHKPDEEMNKKRREIYSPNGHHSKWNIPRGSLVGTPDMVDFVCFRENDVVVLENNGVGVDSALRVNKEGKKARKRQKQTKQEM